MYNTRAQANFIVSLGMIIATALVILTGFNYVHNVGLSSSIEITAQSSIYQTLAAKDYILQQANYHFDQAQLIDGLNLSTAGGCGYISTENITPFIPVPKIYYWRNAAGATCIPNNAQIVLGLEELLNESRFATVNSTADQNIVSTLNLNLSLGNTGVFSGNFSAPFLNNVYLISYNRSTQTYNVCMKTNQGCTLVFNGTNQKDFYMGGKEFVFGGEQDLVSGVLSHPSAVNSFFSGSGISPNSQYVVVTFSNGTEAILYSNEVNGVYSFELTPIINQNVYTLLSAMSEDKAAGLPEKITLVNNSEFTFDGTIYNFEISSNVTGAFVFSPVNYAVVSLQPQFVYYKYLLNSFDVGTTSTNLLFPNNQNLYVSFSEFPLYNPQVCLSYNEVQFTVSNCLSLSGYTSDQNYLSSLLALSTAFINETFPLGRQSIQGFAQYEIDNYLSNVVGGVNLKTVSVNGQPKYDWYSALILALGSPQGTNYLINQLSKVKEPYYGTYIYNCSQNASDLQFCRTLLSQTLSQNIQDLLDKEIPMELSFLSGTSFDINVLNLSVNASEADSCPDYSNNNATASYSFSLKGPSLSGNYSEEVLGIPISLDFGYQNGLKLTPTESCGVENSPYATGYPGFNLALVANTTYINCAPIIARPFLNTTCIASLKTSSQSTEAYIDSHSGAPSNEQCSQVSSGGSTYYYCPYYKANVFSYQNWITNQNSCPSSLLVDGQNFTETGTTSNGNYNQLLSIYGGGVKEAGTSYGTYNNWTFALFNNPPKIPANLSINVGVELAGSNPSFGIILSRNQNLASQFTAVELNTGTAFNGIYNYSETSGLQSISQSKYSAAVGQQENVVVNRYCVSAASCNITFSVNGVNQSYYSSSDLQLLDGGSLSLVGASTGAKTSSDIVNYFFLSSYAPGYNFIKSESQAFPASNLNSQLNSSFGLSTDKGTYYNQITVNLSLSPQNSYEGTIVLNNNFNLSVLNGYDIKIFGVYSNHESQLYWWNQTPISDGGIVWVNLTKELPSYVYVVYGNGSVSSSPYESNGTAVFPFFFYPTADRNNFTSLYPSNQHDYAPSYSSVGLNLTNLEPVPPYVYNSTLSTNYAQFACISVKPSFSLRIINATYSPYKPSFNLASLYDKYNPVYPNLSIISVERYSSWP